MKMLTVGILCFFAQATFAADHEAALKNFLTDEVVAVAYVDLSSIDTLGVLEWAGKLDLVPADQRGEAVLVAAAAQGQLDNLADAGVSHAYLLFRVSDVSHGGPTWVVPIAEGGDANAVLSMIEKWKKVVQSPVLPEYWEAAEGVLLAGTTEPQLEQLKNTRPSALRDLSDAWQSLGQGDVGIVIFGDSDSRRVVREMFPTLPEPFTALNGELIAEGLQWGGATLKLPPEFETNLVIETESGPTADTVAQLMTLGFEKVLALEAANGLLGEDDTKQLLLDMAPQVQGKRVSLEGVKRIDLLTKLLSPSVRAARQTAQRSNRMNTFKNIGIAFHNYHNKHKSFPAHANYDEKGKPLLSWRVHLLPYLDQNALYKQFHLDEPWDSEHNLPLSKILPAIYADPDSALRKINAAGKTTFVVPTGFGTLFDGPEGASIKKIIDGTSNTIMLVEVVPERAVIWTRPADWEVDFGDPLNGVRRSDRDWFNAARCDGSAHSIENAVDEDKLRALLTIAGKESIPYP